MVTENDSLLEMKAVEMMLTSSWILTVSSSQVVETLQQIDHYRGNFPIEEDVSEKYKFRFLIVFTIKLDHFLLLDVH